MSLGPDRGVGVAQRLDQARRGAVVSGLAQLLGGRPAVGGGAGAELFQEVGLPGGLRLAFDTEATIASFHPSWKGDAAGGRVALAFALPDAAAVDDAYAQLTGAGHRGELKPFDAFWGQRYATVLDPDGTGVDLFAPLPGAAATG